MRIAKETCKYAGLLKEKIYYMSNCRITHRFCFTKLKFKHFQHMVFQSAKSSKLDILNERAKQNLIKSFWNRIQSDREISL